MMKFRSIRTRMMTAMGLVIATLVGAVIWVWTTSESKLYHQQKLDEAKSLAIALSESWSGPLYDQNWGQLRLGLDVLLKQNDNIVYIMISDARSQHQIVAASPIEFNEQYVPDIVPVATTDAALASSRTASAENPRAVETYILRNVEFPKGQVRSRQGDRIIEVASDIRIGNGEKIGTFRLGMSLQEVDRAIATAINQALMVGAAGLAFGLFSAYIVAKRLSKPLRRLQRSAAKIAAGDLHHRAQVDISDEIGALANSFNEMSASLQASFSKLEKTLQSFERFVPNKFLSAIAPEGIENIQVGISSTRNMTILFCDIRGYTSLSEQLTPQETFAFLNDYLACMGKAIDTAGGFIDKYIGDAIMALFDQETTDCALHAAILLQKALFEFNAVRSQNSLPTIAVGIGIHRGEVVMGTVGFTSRIESTVIGDAVNLASRIEGLTKTYNCTILVTESVLAGLEYPELFDLRLVDVAVKVKGKDMAIAIYELKI